MSFTQVSRFSTLALRGLFVATAFSFVFAGASYANTTPEFDESLDMIEAVVSAMVGMVGAFTAAVITPMGISAATKTFRHVVLANV